VILDKFSRIPLSSIIVLRDERQRKSFDVSDLVESIRLRGVINPILVRDTTPDERAAYMLDDEASAELYVLIAGERRTEASRQLGLPDIICRHAEDLTASELQILELLENLHRVDLTWQETMAAAAAIHSLFRETAPGGVWTQEATATQIGITPGWLSLYLTVSEESKDRPELLTAKTAREAFNSIKRREARSQGAAIEALFADAGQANAGLVGPADEDEEDFLEGDGVPSSMKPPATGRPPGPRGPLPLRSAISTPVESILNVSFLDWAPTYSGPKFNLIHCDFPYGIDVFSGRQGRGTELGAAYSDSRDVYFRLLDCLCDNWSRLASISTHLMFWYSMKHDLETKRIFREKLPQLEFTTHPLIWGKSDGSGIAGDSQRDFRHTYEVALLGRAGRRNLVKMTSDLHWSPPDRTLHPSTKPEPMLKHFFGSLVDDTTRLLDPTCGSGSAIRAADALGAEFVLGLEIDPEHFANARTALSNARRLRAASDVFSAIGI
jgi:ParB/RepB/Spo0J family partition protein